MTLVFPKSLSSNSPQTAPLANAVPIPNDTSVRSLPSTSNPFSPISQDTTLAFSVPFNEAATFIDGVLEIPEDTKSSRENQNNGRKWAVKTSKNTGNGSIRNLRNWAANAWTGFVDLLKVCIIRFGHFVLVDSHRALKPSISSLWFWDISRCI